MWASGKEEMGCRFTTSSYDIYKFSLVSMLGSILYNIGHQSVHTLNVELQLFELGFCQTFTESSTLNTILHAK